MVERDRELDAEKFVYPDSLTDDLLRKAHAFQKSG
jgi:hypothetical protein